VETGIELILEGHDSFADSPWILKLVEYTKRCIEEKRIRLIGVCFGHQIIGRAMGVKVGRNPDGWEAAVHDVNLSEKGRELFGLKTMVSLCCPEYDLVINISSTYTKCTEILYFSILKGSSH